MYHQKIAHEKNESERHKKGFYKNLRGNRCRNCHVT